jgi:hypothetical protein
VKAALLSGARALVHFVVVEKCLQVRAVCQTAVSLVGFESAARVIAPPALGREPVPDKSIQLAQAAAVRLAPREDLLVRPTGQNPRFERLVLDAHELAETAIESTPRNAW